MTLQPIFICKECHQYFGYEIKTHHKLLFLENTSNWEQSSCIGIVKRTYLASDLVKMLKERIERQEQCVQTAQSVEIANMHRANFFELESLLREVEGENNE